jgi:CarD family transcriptional regulator
LDEDDVMATAQKKSAKHKSTPKAKKKAIVKATTQKKPVAKPKAAAAQTHARKAAVKAKPAARPAVKVPERSHAKAHIAKPAAPAQRPAASAGARPPVALVKPHAPQPAHAQAAQATVKAPAPAGPRKLAFKVNELIVYPAHGVGRIVQIEEQEIAGARLELYIIDFDKEKLRLKVPTSKSEQKGMRKLADKALIDQAMRVLKGRARIKRTMWSRRAQEYEAKINSGDLIAVAEVVRDLYRSEKQPEQSYSERQLFEQALERMAREIAAVKKIDDDMAVKEVQAFLEKNAHRNVKSEEEAPAVVAA